MLLEGGGAAGKRAAGAGEIAEGLDRPRRLANDLRPGVQVMGAEIALQVKLVGAKGVPLRHDALRLALDQLQVGARYLAWRGAGGLFDQHYLSAQRRHHAGAFHGVAS